MVLRGMACWPAKCGSVVSRGGIGVCGWRVDWRSVAGMFRCGGSGAAGEIGGWVACRVGCGGPGCSSAVVQELEVR